ncbi:hypothetical protein M8818_002993 [Zalaria obscura]|uniref:Uncharacterized protein n=1 Tax=Zalaria obscura TaxID=2024903 RepID=A0ACC3SGA2_9PEZI
MQCIIPLVLSKDIQGALYDPIRPTSFDDTAESNMQPDPPQTMTTLTQEKSSSTWRKQDDHSKPGRSSNPSLYRTFAKQYTSFTPPHGKTLCTRCDDKRFHT